MLAIAIWLGKWPLLAAIMNWWPNVRKKIAPKITTQIRLVPPPIAMLFAVLPAAALAELAAHEASSSSCRSPSSRESRSPGSSR